MANNKDSVLLLNGEAVQTLIIAKSLKCAGYDVHLFCNGTDNYGYHTKYASKKTIISTEDEYLYLETVKRYINENGIATVIPMNDEGATFMSKNKQELIKMIPVLLPNWEVFEKGYDKNMLMTFCKDNGYPHPTTIDLEKVSYESIGVEDMVFPAIIKPNYTSGGRGMTLVENPSELRAKYPAIKAEYGSCHLQEFIAPGGKQLKVQVFVDPRDLKVYSSVIHKQRYYPEAGGSSCCNMTIPNGHISKICVDILIGIGWEGFADFDIIEDPKDGCLKIMEINPRIPACIKSSIMSGLNFGEMIADVSLGKPLKDYVYKPGKKLRHIGFEILWFIKSKNRWKTKPNWFKWFDRNLSFQDFSIKDPLPFIYGTIGNIKKQLNPDFRKSKNGLS